MSTTLNRPIRLTRRVQDIEVSPTLQVLNRAQELQARGIDIVDFGPGEPDFGTPLSVAAAAKRAIDEGFTKYTNERGTKTLRDGIDAPYNRRYGTHIATENAINRRRGIQE